MTSARSGGLAGGMRAVLERDFLVLTSAGKFVALRTSVVFALAVLAFSVLTALGLWEDSFAARRERWGQSLFLAFAVAYPVLVALVGPALAAGSITGERSTDTLPLVLAAPVSPLGLVLAKFLSRLGALLVPLLGGLPVAALCFLYGGVGPDLYLAWAGVVLGLATIAVASSVLASAYARTTAGAIVLAYCLACVVPLFESWAAFVLHFEMDWGAGGGDSLLLGHTAIGALASVLEGVSRGATRGPVWPFYVAAAGGSALALLLAAARLSRESQAMAAGGPRRGRAIRRLFENPVLDRATLGLPFRRGGLGAWATLAVVSVIAWTPFLSRALSGRRVDDDEVLLGLNLGTWAVAVVILARASQCLAVERQQGSLALLRTTTLTGGQVVDGKLLGLVVHGAALLAPVVALGLLGVALKHRGLHLISLVAWMASTSVVFLLFTAIGMRVSARAGTGGRAAGMAFGLAFGGMVAIALLGFVVGLSIRFDEDVAIPCFSALPPVFVAMISAAGQSSGSSDVRQALAWSIFWGVVWTLVSIWMIRATSRAVEREES